MKTIKFCAYFLAAALVFQGCDDDDDMMPPIENEEEVITTLRMTFTPDGGGDDIVLEFQDLDADGPDAPTITVNPLDASTDYSVAITLLNETESPAENVTLEIEEEDDEHQFFFDTTVPELTIAYADTDGDGNPVGLSTNVSTGVAGSGLLTVTLRHEPDKNASGVSNGDIANAGGETDIEVIFGVTVQ